MTLLKELRNRFMKPLRKADWKTIVYISFSGDVIFTDGTKGKAISPRQLKVGDRVLVKNGFILQFKTEDIKPVLGAGYIPILIITHQGETTGTYDKKYYLLQGSNIIEVSTPPKWSLIDDGAYGIPLPFQGETDDPFSLTYAVYGDGLRIPYGNNGIAAKKQTGFTARYILNNAIEDETWRILREHPPEGYGFPPSAEYAFLCHPESLMVSFFSYYNTKPFITKYTEEGIIRLSLVWQGMEDTLEYRIEWENTINPDLNLMPNLEDITPTMVNMHRVEYDGTIHTIPIRVKDTDYSAIVGVNQDWDSKFQRIFRTHTYFYTEDEFVNYPTAEPVIEEIYDTELGEFIGEGDQFERCDGTGYCFRSLYKNRIPFMGDLGNVPNDVKIVFASNKKGELDYVRIEKEIDEGATDGFDEISYRSSLVIADKEIDFSGWEATERLERMGGYYVPIPAIKTRYRILHAYHDDTFDMALYRKTTMQDFNYAHIPYYLGGPTAWRLGRYHIKTKTEYFIVVNQEIYPLEDFFYIGREYILTRSDEIVSDFTGLKIVNWKVDGPWLDIGYDDDGAEITDEDNSAIMRIFTSATKGDLLVSFDVYPVKFRHDLTWKDYWVGGRLLGPVYDPSTHPGYDWPTSDAIYSDVKDRKWLLFGKNGKATDIQPPQVYDAEKNEIKNVNRINGLCILDPRD